MQRLFIIIVTLKLLVLESPVSPGQQPASDQKQQDAWPVAAAWIDNFEPQVLADCVREYISVTGDPKPLLFDISKGLKRRFTKPNHVPSEKGILVVFGPTGFERLDFERVFDVAGVKQVLEEFNGQWISAEPREQPIYEVVTHELGKDSWEVEVLSLNWRAIIPDDPKGEITYKKESRKFLSYQFRLFGGFLFTGRNRAILESARLDLLPDALRGTQEAHGRSRLGALWFNPAAVPEPIRLAWFDSFLQTISPRMQIGDAEDSAAAESRIAMLKLKNDVLRSAIFDLEPSIITLETDESGTLFISGTLRARDESDFQRSCDALSPSEVLLGQEPRSESDLSFSLAAAIPLSILQVAGLSASGESEPLTVNMSADLVSLPDSGQSGKLHVRLSDDRLNAVIRSSCLPLLTQQLSKLFNPGGNAPSVAVPAKLRIEEAGNEFTVLLNPVASNRGVNPTTGKTERQQRRVATFEFQVSRSELRRLRDPAVSLQLAPDASEQELSSENISGQITVDRAGVSIAVTANRLAIYELLANLLSHGFRI